MKRVAISLFTTLIFISMPAMAASTVLNPDFVRDTGYSVTMPAITSENCKNDDLFDKLFSEITVDSPSTTDTSRNLHKLQIYSIDCDKLLREELKAKYKKEKVSEQARVNK